MSTGELGQRTERRFIVAAVGRCSGETQIISRRWEAGIRVSYAKQGQDCVELWMATVFGVVQKKSRIARLSMFDLTLASTSANSLPPRK